MRRLDVPPTYPRSYSAGSRTRQKKLTGLTVPRNAQKNRVSRDALAIMAFSSIRKLWLHEKIMDGSWRFLPSSEIIVTVDKELA
jgi:hypothetical protein